MATINFLGQELTGDAQNNLTFPRLRTVVEIPNQIPFPDTPYIPIFPAPTGIDLLNFFFTITVAAERGGQLGRFIDLTSNNDNRSVTFLINSSNPTNDINNFPGGVRGLGGDDRIFVSNNGTNSIINGNLGNDLVNGSFSAYDYIRGGQGVDTLEGGGFPDLINGNLDSDVINGTDSGNFREDNDFLRGGGGNDTIFGNFGNDILIGDVGADFLFGDDFDTLTGSNDRFADVFVLRSDVTPNGPNLSPTRGGADQIFGFTFSTDTNRIDSVIVAGLRRSDISVTLVQSPNFTTSGLVDFEIRVPNQGNAYLGIVRNIDSRQSFFAGKNLVNEMLDRVFFVPSSTEWVLSIG